VVRVGHLLYREEKMSVLLKNTSKQERSQESEASESTAQNVGVIGGGLEQMGRGR